MEAVSSSKTSISVQRIRWYFILEEIHFHISRRKNLRSYPVTHLWGGIHKNQQNTSIDTRSSGQHANAGPLDYEVCDHYVTAFNIIQIVKRNLLRVLSPLYVRNWSKILLRHKLEVSHNAGLHKGIYWQYITGNK